MADSPNPAPLPEARAISLRRRFEILKRDGFTCQYCGAGAPDVVLQVDHIVPRVRGGTSDPSNLVTACVDCNAGKHCVPLDFDALWELYGPGRYRSFPDARYPRRFTYCVKTGRHTYTRLAPGDRPRYYANLAAHGLGGVERLPLCGPRAHQPTTCRDTAQAALRHELAQLASSLRRGPGSSRLYVLMDSASHELRVGKAKDAFSRARSWLKHRPRVGVLVDLSPEQLAESFGARAGAVSTWVNDLLANYRFEDGWIPFGSRSYWMIERLSEVGRLARAPQSHPIVSLWNRSLTDWAA